MRGWRTGRSGTASTPSTARTERLGKNIELFSLLECVFFFSISTIRVVDSLLPEGSLLQGTGVHPGLHSLVERNAVSCRSFLRSFYTRTDFSLPSCSIIGLVALGGTLIYLLSFRSPANARSEN